MRYFAFLALFLDKIHVEKMFKKNQPHMPSVFITLKLLPWKQHLLNKGCFLPLPNFLSFLELKFPETFSVCQS